MEEHVSIVTKPIANYFNHTTPKSGSSQDISNSIVKRLKNRNANTDDIQVVGCNGTNVNTGQMAGVNLPLEESFIHPLQWLVCLVQANELPLRHLF